MKFRKDKITAFDIETIFSFRNSQVAFNRIHTIIFLKNEILSRLIN